MSFSTYSDLQTAVADWLNRTDLTATVPDFISLAEAEIKRRLRRTSVRTTITISSEETTPPTDMAELRSISLETASPSGDVPLNIVTPEMLAETRARNDAVAGRPTDAAYMAGKIVVSPSPDQSYTARILYYSSPTSLSATVSTNTVLAEAPDAYLYGSLLQAAPYLEHDERIPVWREAFDRAIDQLNEMRTREEYAAGLKNVRLPVVFD